MNKSYRFCITYVLIDLVVGIFYGGRNKFLYSKDSKNEKGEKPASLEPPLDFMTRLGVLNISSLSS